MQKPMKTAGELRDFLLGLMDGVRDGSVDLQRASTVAKLAAQVTASLVAEAQMALVAEKTGREFGSAALGAPDAETTARSEPQRAIASGRRGEPIWCGQCEQRVHPEKVKECKSAFCKAKQEAA